MGRPCDPIATHYIIVCEDYFITCRAPFQLKNSPNFPLHARGRCDILLEYRATGITYADVAELADALDSGSSEREFMWVQVPSSAP